jgi:hypothetical protein
MEKRNIGGPRGKQMATDIRRRLISDRSDGLSVFLLLRSDYDGRMEENPYEAPKIPSDDGRSQQKRRIYLLIFWAIVACWVAGALVLVLPAVKFYLE